MKKYTKPIVVKVELNHEQAVLGTCSGGIDQTKDSALNQCCNVSPNKCKQFSGSGDSGYTS